jgi:hypothetical protein
MSYHRQTQVPLSPCFLCWFFNGLSVCFELNSSPVNRLRYSHLLFATSSGGYVIFVDVTEYAKSVLLNVLYLMIACRLVAKWSSIVASYVRISNLLLTSEMPLFMTLCIRLPPWIDSEMVILLKFQVFFLDIVVYPHLLIISFSVNSEVLFLSLQRGAKRMLLIRELL